jgi:DNA-binding CsgD family transcriptional regulator
VFTRLLRRLGFYRPGKAIPVRRMFLETIEGLAYQEQRPVADVADDLLAIALDQLAVNEASYRCWQSLTRREQEVAALICLNYSNAEIAQLLSISLSTVKAHVHNILVKFNSQNRSDVKAMLSGFDFTSWFESKR